MPSRLFRFLSPRRRQTSRRLRLHADADQVFRPLCASRRFREAIDLALATITAMRIDTRRWARAPYHPTPTIIEAARALYAQHSVEAIARYDAGAENLRVTSRRVEELVDEARATTAKDHLLCHRSSGRGKNTGRLEHRDATPRSGERRTLCSFRQRAARRGAARSTHAR